MKNKTLLVVLNAGLLLVMFSRMFGGAANMLMLDGLAVAGIAGVMYWRSAKHGSDAKQKEGK
ncbi:hypothetical protein [Lacticaseibacillus hulanensis]|uniref:hypothetical protein n=1 Tax=Lacticaseibacillus hulanensis TaxID=2493111 RepID=UPI000FD7C84D|nr:hypothetical protein [Lacticaseibacillus hulanensis]